MPKPTKSRLVLDLTSTLPGLMEKAAVRAVTAVAEEFTGDLKETYNAPGRGEVVTRYNPKRTHQQSLPGDPPAKDQGKLQQSVTYNVTKGAGKVSAEAGPNTVYARRQELGFKGYDKAGRYVTHEPRPAVYPTWESNLSKYKRIAAAEAQEELRV